MIWEEGNISVELTYDYLDVVSIMNKVKSPKAGAVVIFAGTSHLLPTFTRAQSIYQAQHEILLTPNP